jgi:hypothetical protein
VGQDAILRRILNPPIVGADYQSAAGFQPAPHAIIGPEAAVYHYDPAIALEELQEDAVLPNPVHIRDMIVRARLKPDQALELNRKFQSYLQAFGDTQEIAKLILQPLARPE